MRLGISPSVETARLEVASRTDRGVSARANALGLESPLAAGALLRALNGIAPEILFTGATEVTDPFRIRAATQRTYRYCEPPRGRDIHRLLHAARLLEGDVDVRSFGRSISGPVPILRAVESVRILPSNGGLVVEIAGRSFVWGMVRKMVAALREVDAGRLSLSRLAAAVSGRARLTLPLAEPEPLVLWEVTYPVPWTHAWAGPNRGQARWIAAVRDSLWTRARFLEVLEDGPLASPSPPRG